MKRKNQKEIEKILIEIYERKKEMFDKLLQEFIKKYENFLINDKEKIENILKVSILLYIANSNKEELKVRLFNYIPVFDKKFSNKIGEHEKKSIVESLIRKIKIVYDPYEDDIDKEISKRIASLMNN